MLANRKTFRRRRLSAKRRPRQMGGMYTEKELNDVREKFRSMSIEDINKFIRNQTDILQKRETRSKDDNMKLAQVQAVAEEVIREKDTASSAMTDSSSAPRLQSLLERIHSTPQDATAVSAVFLLQLIDAVAHDHTITVEQASEMCKLKIQPQAKIVDVGTSDTRAKTVIRSLLQDSVLTSLEDERKGLLVPEEGDDARLRLVRDVDGTQDLKNHPIVLHLLSFMRDKPIVLLHIDSISGNVHKALWRALAANGKTVMVACDHGSAGDPGSTGPATYFKDEPRPFAATNDSMMRVFSAGPFTATETVASIKPSGVSYAQAQAVKIVKLTRGGSMTATFTGRAVSISVMNAIRELWPKVKSKKPVSEYEVNITDTVVYYLTVTRRDDNSIRLELKKTRGGTDPILVIEITPDADLDEVLYNILGLKTDGDGGGVACSDPVFNKMEYFLCNQETGEPTGEKLNPDDICHVHVTFDEISHYRALAEAGALCVRFFQKPMVVCGQLTPPTQADVVFADVNGVIAARRTEFPLSYVDTVSRRATRSARCLASRMDTLSMILGTTKQWRRMMKAAEGESVDPLLAHLREVGEYVSGTMTRAEAYIRQIGEQGVSLSVCEPEQRTPILAILDKYADFLTKVSNNEDTGITNYTDFKAQFLEHVKNAYDLHTSLLTESTTRRVTLTESGQRLLTACFEEAGITNAANTPALQPPLDPRTTPPPSAAVKLDRIKNFLSELLRLHHCDTLNATVRDTLTYDPLVTGTPTETTTQSVLRLYQRVYRDRRPFVRYVTNPVFIAMVAKDNELVEELTFEEGVINNPVNLMRQLSAFFKNNFDIDQYTYERLALFVTLSIYPFVRRTSPTEQTIATDDEFADELTENFSELKSLAEIQSELVGQEGQVVAAVRDRAFNVARALLFDRSQAEREEENNSADEIPVVQAEAVRTPPPSPARLVQVTPPPAPPTEPGTIGRLVGSPPQVPQTMDDLSQEQSQGYMFLSPPRKRTAAQSGLVPATQLQPGKSQRTEEVNASVRAGVPLPFVDASLNSEGSENDSSYVEEENSSGSEEEEDAVDASSASRASETADQRSRSSSEGGAYPKRRVTFRKRR